MPNKEYDTLICNAVKNDPYGFVDILIAAAETEETDRQLLLEAACVIANLLDKQGGKIE